MFASLPHLKTLRILLQDYLAEGKHLGGWFLPEDEVGIDEAWQCGQHMKYDSMYDVTCEGTDPFRAVWGAIGTTGNAIQDLQVGLGRPNTPYSRGLHYALHNSGMGSSLRRLRMILKHRQLCPIYPNEEGHDDIVMAFKLLPNLTHLSLELHRENSRTPPGEATTHLIQILKPLARLEQLTLIGDWKYSSHNIMEFVSSHNQTLQLLALRNPGPGGFLDIGDQRGPVILRLMYVRPCALKMFDVELKDREIPEMTAGEEEAVKTKGTYGVRLKSPCRTWMVLPRQSESCTKLLVST
jgi:hypothetical protein